MVERMISNTPLAKAIRIVLVFSLVFWVSFRVECFAFASFDNGSGHDSEVLTGLAVHKAETGEDGAIKAGSKVLGAGEESGTQSDLTISSNGGSVQLVAVPSWTTSEQSGDGDDPVDEPSSGGDGDSSGSSSSGGSASGGSGDSSGSGNNDGSDDDNDQGQGEGSGGNGEGTNDETQNQESTGLETESERESGSATETRGVVAPQAEGELDIASFVQWSFSEGTDASLATINTDDDGVATVTGTGFKSGTVTVECTLKDASEFPGTVDPELQKLLPISVTVNLKAPYVGALTIMKPDPGTGEKCTDGEAIELDDTQREGYQFWAQVQITDAVKNETRPFDITPDKKLSQVDDGAYGDLAWRLLVKGEGDEEVPLEDEAVATISEDGKLVLKGEGPVIVVCTAEHGLDDEPISMKVSVSAKSSQQEDDPAARQGASNPQDELTIVIERPKSTESDSSENSDESAASGESADANSSESAASGESASSSASSEASSSGESSDADGQGEGETEVETTTKTYDVSKLEAIEGGLGQEKYTLKIDDEMKTVTGRGVTLATLLNDAGVALSDESNEQQSIDKLYFENANGEKREVSWSDLVALSQSEQSYVMVATQAYVHPSEQEEATEGDSTEGDSTEGESTEGDSTEGEQAEGEQTADANQGNTSSSGQSSSGDITFYDNTRFQLLYDDSAGVLDGSSLRWINKITVTMKAEESEEEEEEEVDPTLRVSISYVPVPKGRTAFLSAVPNLEVGSSRFGFTWERSTDGGETWEMYNDESIQTLRVTTDDTYIDNMFRVILETDLKNEETGEPRTATSEPVTIKVGSGLVLDYVPPLAGDIAEFVSHFELSEEDNIDVSNPQYIWEQSSDGGATWTTFSGETGSTLRIPTNPIDESASSSDSGGAATLIYIRVRAIVPDHDPLESNWCPLTVRTGDTSGGGSANKEKKITDELNKDSKKKTKSKKKKVTEIPSPKIEHSRTTISDYIEEPEVDEEIEEEPEDIGSANIVIDEAVTNKIKDQEKAAKQEAESSTPGARWTEISAMNPSDEEVQNILADNPFAPFAMPMGLGITIAGGLEKLLAFRRQL